MYKRIYESSADTIALLDPQTNQIIGVNSSAIKMFRAKNEKELIKIGPPGVSPKYQSDGRLSSEKAAEMMALAIKNGTHFFEWIHKRLDGTDFPTTVLLASVKFNNEIFLYGTVKDITKEKQIQQRLDLALEASGTGLWDWNLKTNETYFSPTYYTMLGYEPDEFSACYKSWRDRVHPDDLGKTEKRLKDYLAGGEPFSLEFRMKSKDDSWCWIHARGKVVKHDENNKPIRMTGTHTNITERKQAEEALRQSEEQVRMLLDSTAEAIYGLDLDGNCTFCNPACLEMLGYNKVDDLLGKNMHDLIHHTRSDGSAYPMEQCRIYEAFQLGEGSHITDEVFWRADKTSFPAEYWSYPTRHDGEIVGSVVTFIDITERKRTEAQLNYRLEFEAIISEISAGFIDVDSNGIQSEMNKALEKIGTFAGVDRSYIFQFHADGKLADNTHEWCADGIVPQIDSLKDIDVGNELPWFAKKMQDNEVFYVPDVNQLPPEASIEKEHFQSQDIQSLLVLPMTYGSDLKGFVGFDAVKGLKAWSQDDISLLGFLAEILTNAIIRKQTEESMRHANDIVVHSSVVAFRWENEEGWPIGYASENVKAMFGWTSEDFLSGAVPYLNVIHPDDLSHVEEEITKFSDDVNVAVIRHEPYRIVTKDGQIKWVEDLTTIQRAADGTIVAYEGILFDITERKHAEEQAEQINKQLIIATEKANELATQAEWANKAKSQFLANMSHEIRTPLNSIVGFSDILAMGTLSEEQNEHLDYIRESSSHLLELIDDILDYSKIEADKIELEMSVCSLPEIFTKVETMMHPFAAKKGIAFRINSDPAVPTNICTDPTRLLQCLINLVNNAIKFTDIGHVHLNVALKNTDDGYFISFAVEDSGIGIPEDKQAAIFDSFTQADGSTTRKYGGTGLGLAITKQLANLFGGDLDMTSKTAMGSVFTFTIPIDCDLLQNNEISEPLPTEQNKVELDEDVTFAGKVLVAEDNPTNQMLMKALLNRTGIVDLQIVDDGRGAIELAVETDSFDLIFMDMQMPNVNGYEATSLLRKRGVTTPIIALTANAMKGDDKKCLNAGCDEYLSKPINLAKLRKVLAKYLKTQVLQKS
jgi:PAS domain S-box-containing protein